MQRDLIPLTSLAVENLTVGRMEAVRFIEEAGAATRRPASVSMLVWSACAIVTSAPLLRLWR